MPRNGWNVVTSFYLYFEHACSLGTDHTKWMCVRLWERGRKKREILLVFCRVEVHRSCAYRNFISWSNVIIVRTYLPPTQCVASETYKSRISWFLHILFMSREKKTKVNCIISHQSYLYHTKIENWIFFNCFFIIFLPMHEAFAIRLNKLFRLVRCKRSSQSSNEQRTAKIKI